MKSNGDFGDCGFDRAVQGPPLLLLQRRDFAGVSRQLDAETKHQIQDHPRNQRQHNHSRHHEKADLYA